MIETNPDEALLVFEKWKSEGADIVCTPILFGWGFIFRGRVASLSRNEVVLTSSDGTTRMTVPFLAEDLMFGYAEAEEFGGRDFPPGLVGLVVGLPLRLRPSEFEALPRVPKREKLVFMNLPPQPTNV